MSGVRPPRQSRGRESLDRLLDAAEEILAEQGVHGLTIAALSERSGMSNGAIYWRVDSLESLHLVVQQRLEKRLESEHDAYDEPDRWTGLTLSEFVSASVRTECEVFRRHAGAVRAQVLSTATDPVMRERGAVTVQATERRFVEHLRPRLEQTGCAEAELVAVEIFRIAFGALTARVTWPEQQEKPTVSWERFIDDLCEMVAAFAIRATGCSD